MNIMNLVKALFEQNQKVIHGGLLIIHALIYVNEGAIEQYIEFIGPSIVSSVKNTEDENCVRFSCGLISDLSNYLEKNMSKYANEFILCLNEVLKSSEFQVDTKINALIAVGDICLATEENFQQYLDDTMSSLF